MYPLLTWCTGIRGGACGSSALWRLLANFTFLLGLLLAFWWLLGYETISLFSQKIASGQIFLEITQDYVLLTTVGVAIFILGTILHGFLKIQLQPSSSAAPVIQIYDQTVSMDISDRTGLSIQSGIYDDEESYYYEGEPLDATVDSYTQFYDVISTVNDVSDMCPNIAEETSKTENSLRTHSEDTGQHVKHTVDHSTGMSDHSRLMKVGSSCGLKFDTSCSGELDKMRPLISKNVGTQTDDITKPALASKTTMTHKPQLVDAAVGTQKLFKVVKSSDTTTSGPFMKKLRRAQRLLKEARLKFKTERQAKLATWAGILQRYKDRVHALLQSLDKKDILLSYTALNRALSENEVKDMCTSVSSARDRLLTQCKLNFALKEVVDSKCDSGTSEVQNQNTNT